MATDCMPDRDDTLRRDRYGPHRRIGVVLDVPPDVYATLRALLLSCGHGHAVFGGGDGHEAIDLHGIALRSKP